MFFEKDRHHMQFLEILVRLNKLILQDHAEYHTGYGYNAAVGTVRPQQRSYALHNVWREAMGAALLSNAEDFHVVWSGSKLNRRGKPQVLFPLTDRATRFGITRFFEPRPCGLERLTGFG